MARPAKQGLDYFPMDVVTDDKFEIIEAKHGLIGFAILIKLYQKIYRDGYYIPWDNVKLFMFKKALGVDADIVKDVIEDALEFGIFNKDLYDVYGVLTSRGIQTRFFNACYRRKSVEVSKEILLISEVDIPVPIIRVNVYNNPS